MKKIKVKCPAKINLTLEVVNRREDGFHNINSIMQLISLYDYLVITVNRSSENIIQLEGNSKDIPYNNSNLVYRAAESFLKKANIKGYTININIDKNIPVSAGLAGGSTDGAGTIYGLNKLFDNKLNDNQVQSVLSELGSDLNVCYEGGCLLATSRGEKTKHLPVINKQVTLIKPRNIGISAKEAYTKYAAKKFKPQNNMTEKMIDALRNNKDIQEYLYNDLEYAVFDDYNQLQTIKMALPKSIMSGSGSTYFILDDCNLNFGSDYEVIRGLHFIKEGITEVL